MENTIKISLISPYDTISNYGLRLISAYMKEKGHKVKLIFLPYRRTFSGHFYKDLYSETVFEDLLDLCQDSDLIGFSVMTNYFLKVKDLTMKLKHRSDIPIIWGGIHPSVKPEECLKYADFICIGEGEEAILELADKWKSGDISSVKNIWFKKESKIVKNELRHLEEDLNKYPFQDYDLNSHYILRGTRIVKMTENLFKDSLPHEDETGELRKIYVTASVRNCPHNCTYCCNNALRKLYEDKRRFVRKRAVSHFINELENVKKRFGFIRHIAISDDTFFIRSEDEIREFSELYREKISLPLSCSLSPQTFDEEKLECMVDAGLFRVSVGIQSMDSQTLLNLYKRPTPAEMITKMVETLKKHRTSIPRPVYHIIVDNPYESNVSKKKNIEFVMSLPARARVHLYPLVFYPGTELYEKAKKDGLIKDEIKEIYLKSWTIDDVQRLDYLTCVLYIVVWTKLSKTLMKLMNKASTLMLKDKMISLLDKKWIITLMVLFLKTFIIFVNTFRKLK